MTQADDGYSGTNFERPGVKRLLEAVRKDEIGCIIVKDLSRLGRNYLEIGKIIEQIFTYLGVRFIAINDRYDSNNHIGTTADLDVPVRNIINDLYSRDISKKVKDVKRNQALQGKHANAFASYGYKKDEVDKHRIVIDEAAATVVRYIFELACDGQGSFQIANSLNEKGVLTPSEYKKSNGCKLAANSITGGLWSSGSVINILRDERYTGIFIGGKVEMGKLGSGKRIYKPKEEWIRIPDAHPAIIASEIWDKSVIKRGNGSRKRNKSDNSQGRVLHKNVYCGYCGHILRYKATGKYKYYNCQTPRYTDKYGCLSKGYHEQVIIDVLKTAVQSQITAILSMEKLFRSKEKSINKSILSAQTAAAQIDEDILQLKTFKLQLYNQYKDEIIDMDAHFKARKEADDDISKLTAERFHLLSQIKKQKGALDFAYQFFDSFLKYKKIKEPSNEMLNELVESVYIYDINRIQVNPSFEDDFKQALLKMNV